MTRRTRLAALLVSLTGTCAARGLTIQEVMMWHELGLPTEVICQRVANSPSRFTPEEVAAMERVGDPPSLVSAVKTANATPPAPPKQPPGVVATETTGTRQPLVELTGADALANVVMASSPPGSPTDGALWYDTTNRMLWQYDNAASAWLSQPFDVDFNPLEAFTFSESTVAMLQAVLLTTWDCWIEQCLVQTHGGNGAWDANNKWTFRLVTTSTLAQAEKIADGYSRDDLTPSEASRRLDSDTQYRLVIMAAKTGTPGELSSIGATVRMRYVWE